MSVRKFTLLAALLLAAITGRAQAGMFITEWMYNGLGVGSVGEYVEFTNTGPSPVNMTGWSFDDASRSAGSENLTAFGTVAVGESVIFTDVAAGTFRTNWNLPATVKIIGGNMNNLGRGDEINLYDNSNTLVDRLTYDDQNIAGSPRTNNVSANPKTLAALHANDATQWKLSVNNDVYGSYLSSLGEIGNPGKFTLFVTPEPGTVVLAGFGLLALGLWRRRSNRVEG